MYETLWRDQLAPAQAELMACAGLMPGERVLDVACGTGIIALDAAARVSPGGDVVGVDLSGRMVGFAQRRAMHEHCTNVGFERMDAEKLDLPDSSFNVSLCALGLMYMPSPERAILEMRRVARPDGRIILAVWGERSRCGWAELFPIVDAEVASDVCPLFFRLGQGETLAQVCLDAGLHVTASSRISATLVYSDDNAACDAAFVAGPVALAWSRLDEAARNRARLRYLESIAIWRRQDCTYRIPGEFVIVAASVPNRNLASQAVRTPH
ncbi:MAG: methyltransferase domain-containing protein [Steroidobacteraceae bacterium]|jgi:SAM-dependent methyltransferase